MGVRAVAIYHSARGRGEIKMASSYEENVWSRHQHLFEENVRKNKRRRSAYFENEGSRVVYA